MTIAVFGLGEAGGHIAFDLAEHGFTVHGFDPRDVETPAGVRRFQSPVACVADADFVFALTASSDATTALEQALGAIPEQAVYADFSTASPGLKRALAGIAAGRSLGFVDVALMAPVPGNGVLTPMAVCGNRARELQDLLVSVGTPLEWVSEHAGDAATRKLLRSVMMKGLAALLIEAMRAGQAAGLGEWLWRNMSEQLAVADEALIRRLVEGTKPHALRRLHEMEASTALLEELNVDPLMTRSTTESLRRMLKEELPELPEVRG